MGVSQPAQWLEGMLGCSPDFTVRDSDPWWRRYGLLYGQYIGDSAGAAPVHWVVGEVLYIVSCACHVIIRGVWCPRIVHWCAHD